MRTINRWKIFIAGLAILSSIVTIIISPPSIRFGCIFILIGIILYPTANKLLTKIQKRSEYDIGLPRAPYRVLPANADDIRWIASTAQYVYSGLDIMPLKLMEDWYNANPTGFFIIRDRDGHLCGNLDILPLKPDVLSRFLHGDIIELDLQGNCLLRPEESIKIEYLYVESFVAVSEGYKGNPLAAYTCLMKFPEIIKYICDPSQLKTIYAIGASEAGIRLMKDLGFNEIEYNKKRKDDHKMFFINFDVLCRNLLLRADGEDRSKLFRMLKVIDENPAL